MGKLRVGAGNHHWFAESLDVWCHGVDLGAVNWSDERGDILIPSKLAEREHNSRVESGEDADRAGLPHASIEQLVKRQ